MNDLQDIIKAEIARTGPISFARFMEVALYCPIFGYYERQDVSPGQMGDFYTSVSVGELFGELLANQFSEWLLNADRGARNAEGQIVEAGAHDGRLAADILRWMRHEREELFASLKYWILEPSPLRRLAQQENLAEFAESVQWYESWQQVPASGVNGIIFSNELLDAMPVHRLGWDATKKEWFEWGVTWQNDHFAWVRLSRDATRSALRTPHSALPTELLDVLPDGFITEICPAALDWWRDAARALKAGKLMTIDYGLKAEQFFTPERKDGTLRAYHQHHQSNDLLANPGEQDLTAHVNFTAIQSAGEAEGLKTEIFTTQRQFLTHIIEKNCCDNPTVKEWTSSRVRQFQTLTHPEHLGQRFHVLVQGRGWFT
ncbi:MAG TPA: SAM-dependent methyltransferase [Verrucomicrobiae bacterium]|nr:SAM-dependent methyltransferase [Verrucomicrobiae bacterium]